MILEFSQSETQIKNAVNDSNTDIESTQVELAAVEKNLFDSTADNAHHLSENMSAQDDHAHRSGTIQRSDNAMLMLRMDDDVRRCWPLNHTKPFIIGRDDECDLVLADRQVSRRHAAIHWDGKSYQIEDLGSTNGTYINGKSAADAISLMDGDEFLVGHSFRIAFVDDGATAPLSLEPVRTGLSIDMGNRTVRIGNEVLDPPLSPPQFHLLQILWDANSSIVSRDDIAETVWPEDSIDGISEQAIDALVRRLRERIAEIDPENTYIATIRGHGFRLNNRSTD